MNTDPYRLHQHLPKLILSGGKFKQRYQLLTILIRSMKMRGVDIRVIDESCHNSTDSKDPHQTTADCLISCKEDPADSNEIFIHEESRSAQEPVFRLRREVDIEKLDQAISGWLEQKVLAVPVWGCLLIGGKSTRMGRPKHLIEDGNGTTWCEKIAATLSEHTSEVLLSGEGEIPESLGNLPRLTDVSGVQGPLAGILAALRWKTDVTWLVAACDLPGITDESVAWLLGSRTPGVWGTVPLHPETKKKEPLFAHYDFRSRVLFEEIIRKGSMRPNEICQSNRVESPAVPMNLLSSWRNCNTPLDLID